MRHLTKAVTKGLASTKCGLENQSLFNTTVWWRDVDCPSCSPYEWKPAPPVGKKMVRKKAAPKVEAPPKQQRRVVKVPE
jgi:hypothetical protein